MNVKYVSLVILAILGCTFTPYSAASSAENSITIYADNYVPFSYPNEDGEIVGPTTSLVRMIMDQTNLKYQIKTGPWTRIYRNAKTQKNVFVYSVARIPERETYFDWLAPLFTDEYYLIASRSDQRQITRNGIENGKFTSFCLIDGIVCSLLKTAGFPDKNVIKFAPGGVYGAEDYAVQMVQTGRADLIPESLFRYNGILQQKETYISQFHPVHPLGEVELFLAAGNLTDQNIRNAVKSAYRYLRNNGKYKPLNTESIRKKPTNK